LVVFDAALREKIAALYRNAYLLRVGGRMIAYGSIFPAVWNFQLALHARSYGSCVTTLHLHHEDAVCELLGIPETYVQGCRLPVGRLHAGRRFRAATRRPIEDVVAVDGWDGLPVTGAAETTP
jgi:nitroreductase